MNQGSKKFIFQKSFTLIELMVVIAIIGLLSSIVLVGIREAVERAKAAKAVSFADALRRATEIYEIDMGFYPSDVGRGWDPGFTHSLPFNPDTEQTFIPSCDHCPSNWVEIIQNKWKGPYIERWLQFTPWNGKYDYNYWGSGAIRYGCNVSPGIYIGIQRDYEDKNPISLFAESYMVSNKIDADECINGETQLLLHKL